MFSTDLEPPEITCPDDIILQADKGTHSTEVWWEIPYVWDNVGISSITSSHTNGSIFYIGSETVFLSALDYSNNTASCNFSVIIEGMGSNLSFSIIACLDVIYLMIIHSHCFSPKYSTLDKGIDRCAYLYVCSPFTVLLKVLFNLLCPEGNINLVYALI